MLRLLAQFLGKRLSKVASCGIRVLGLTAMWSLIRHVHTRASSSLRGLGYTVVVIWPRYPSSSVPSYCSCSLLVRGCPPISVAPSRPVSPSALNSFNAYTLATSDSCNNVPKFFAEISSISGDVKPDGLSSATVSHVVCYIHTDRTFAPRYKLLVKWGFVKRVVGCYGTTVNACNVMCYASNVRVGDVDFSVK